MRSFRVTLLLSLALLLVASVKAETAPAGKPQSKATAAKSLDDQLLADLEDDKAESQKVKGTGEPPLTAEPKTKQPAKDGQQRRKSKPQNSLDEQLLEELETPGGKEGEQDPLDEVGKKMRQ